MQLDRAKDQRAISRRSKFQLDRGWRASVGVNKESFEVANSPVFFSFTALGASSTIDVPHIKCVREHKSTEKTAARVEYEAAGKVKTLKIADAWAFAIHFQQSTQQNLCNKQWIDVDCRRCSDMNLIEEWELWIMWFHPRVCCWSNPPSLDECGK